MSGKKFTILITTLDNSLSLSIKWCGNSSFCLVFKGNCLKQENTTFTPPNNFFYCLWITWSRDLNSDVTLKDCLFGGIKLAKNADPDKYVHSSYGIRFDSCSEFSLADGSVGKNYIIFGVDMSLPEHTDNKGKVLHRWYYVNSRSSIFN